MLRSINGFYIKKQYGTPARLTPQPRQSIVTFHGKAFRFSGKAPDSFEPYYKPYAHLTLTHTDPRGTALRAIDKDSRLNEQLDGQLCVVRLEYLSMAKRSRNAYKQLLKNGYSVELILTPGDRGRLWYSTRALNNKYVRKISP